MLKFDILPAVNDEDSSNETPMPWSVTGFVFNKAAAKYNFSEVFLIDLYVVI